MTRGKLTDAATLEAISAGIGPGQRWAELCGPEGIDDGEPDADHPGYGSLLGLGVRKPVKKPVIVLDPEVAEQAAQVMEINAGQLVVRPDKSAHGFGSLGFGALGGDGEEEPFDALGEAGEPYDEDDEELDAAVAEWAARLPASGDEEFDDAWPQESPVDRTAVEEPAEEPAHEEAVVERAWLEWAMAMVETPVPAEVGGLAEHTGDEPAELSEHAALAHTVDDIEAVEPELPKHELRQMLAQISRPHPSRHLWRRLLAFLRRLFG